MILGCPVQPGQLVHADKHGFLAIPRCDEGRLPDAAGFAGLDECQIVIAAARNSNHKTTEEIFQTMDRAGRGFRQNAKGQYGGKGEW